MKLSSRNKLSTFQINYVKLDRKVIKKSVGCENPTPSEDNFYN